VTDEEAEKIRVGKTSADKDAIWTQNELDDTEEYVPDVRDNPGKIGIRFTERPRPGVPVRDRGRQAAPYPKDAPKTDGLPPMIAGDEMEDENDPVWLKDKADKLMVRADYQGAYSAYTEALKLASNSRCFANRAVAAMYLGNLEQCLEDCNHSIRILDLRNRTRPGEMQNTADPEDQKVRARVEVRMGAAYLWLGAFSKSEAHFQKAVDTENGLEEDELKQVKSTSLVFDSEVLHCGSATQAAIELAIGARDLARERSPFHHGSCQDFRHCKQRLHAD